jgi:hypothetical protein
MEAEVKVKGKVKAGRGKTPRDGWQCTVWPRGGGAAGPLESPGGCCIHE